MAGLSEVRRDIAAVTPAFNGQLWKLRLFSPYGELTAFFGAVARAAQELADFLPTQGDRPLADTTVFQSWPVIRIADGERYYCCDVAGLMDKTGRGLYWTLFGAADKATKFGVKEIEVRVKGPGSGRESAITALQSAGLTVKAIEDVTPLPHNGCRPPKKRRV